MSPANKTPSSPPKYSISRALAVRFSLLHGKADNAVIDETLRDSVELRGATPWLLMFAIFIASIGLNVNSTAVIIGAMLISPLMGPIMGLGYGIAIYDFPLIRKSLLNLGIAALISLVTSTLYFLITPLSDSTSEILARTSPSIWDVLIALFGGLAGIVGVTRKEKSNVIPGVAIATALMPPLCTAGYGLANGNWSYFFGAFYLFSINCVFIAVAAMVVIGFFRLPHHTFVDSQFEKRIKYLIFFIVALTALPSVYLAYKLVQVEIYNGKARSFLKDEFHSSLSHVTQSDINPADKRIEISLVGEPISQTNLNLMQSRLTEAGLPGTKLIVHQSGDNRVDVTSLKAGIISDLYRDSQQVIDQQDKKIVLLQNDLAERAKLSATADDIGNELKAQYPEFTEVFVSEGTDQIRTVGTAAEPKAAIKNQRVAVLSAKSNVPVSDADRDKILTWFKVRTKTNAIRLFIDAPELPANKSRRTKRR